MKPDPTRLRLRRTLRKLIHAYKNMPHLWDKKHKEYFNKQLRFKDFQKLTAILQEAEPDATIYSVRKRIDNLRSAYTKELKKVKASRLTATDPQNVYEPSLWHYKELSFLEDVIDPQPALPPVSDESELTTVDVKVEVTSKDDPLNRDSHEYQAEPSESSSDDRQLFSYYQTRPSTSVAIEHSSVDNHDDILGRSISVQLRDVPQRQKVIAMKLISDAIFYANLGKLKENSRIQLE